MPGTKWSRHGDPGRAVHRITIAGESIIIPATANTIGLMAVELLLRYIGPSGHLCTDIIVVSIVVMPLRANWNSLLLQQQQ